MSSKSGRSCLGHRSRSASMASAYLYIYLGGGLLGLFIGHLKGVDVLAVVLLVAGVLCIAYGVSKGTEQ